MVLNPHVRRHSVCGLTPPLIADRSIPSRVSVSVFTDSGPMTPRALMMVSEQQRRRAAQLRRRGSVVLEYLLLATIVGLGVIVGLAVVRDALVTELKDLAFAIRLLL